MTTGRINQIAIAIPRRRRRVVMVCLTGLAWSPAQRYPPPSYHLVWFSVALMLVGSFTLLKEAQVTLSRDKQLTSAVTSFSLTASRRHLLVSFIIRHQLVPSIQSRSVWESAIYIYICMTVRPSRALHIRYLRASHPRPASQLESSSTCEATTIRIQYQALISIQ